MAITKVGESQSFSYTGGVQSFTVPFDGIYKLEVWGAKGGYGGGQKSGADGGYGGYSVGYKGLISNSTLYICCGGAGGSASGGWGTGGGYNGGGGGKSSGWDVVSNGGGGGATHISTVSGVLSSLSSYKDTGEILIVAGGGGGSGSSDKSWASQGGTGGGIAGSGGSSGAGGGTQTSAGSADWTGTSTGGGFGQGSTTSAAAWGNGGGGGGWYGGGAGYGGAGGGSGCIKFTPTFTIGTTTYESTTTNGINNGNGKATITYIAPAELYTITYNLNSGTQGSGAVTSYTISTETFDLPTPTRTNYMFKGWYETSDFTSAQVTKIEKGSVGNKTFYAKWFGPVYASFGYSGGIQTFTVPVDGVWKLEVYGAKGGDGWGQKSGGTGGWGGYSVNYKALKKGTNLYIGCGGGGGSAGGGWGVGGGYNGGGGGKSSGWDVVGNGGGGGATHIARDTNRGALSAYANYKDEILIVAGGGGGGGSSDKNWGSAGGAGGGINGSGASGGGGTQTGRGSLGTAGTGGGFGQGATTSAAAWGNGGGGGGWYGGGAGYGGAGGGSGFIGSSTSPYSVTIAGKTYECSTRNGANGGNGSAKLTWMGPTTLFYYKGQPVEQVIYDGVEVESMKFAGTEIF